MTGGATRYDEGTGRLGPAAGARERSRGTPARIGYWIFNFDPRWEAASKELDTLATAFGPVYGTRTISLNTNKGAATRFGRDKHLPAVLGLPALPLLMRAARSVSINHIFASAGERILLPRLARLDGSILTITKASRALSAIERNAKALAKLRYVVVESERHYDLLMQLGLDPDRVRLIYPGVQRESYRRARGPFTILFATSPRHRHYLLTRGIYLIMKAAERLPSVRFRLVWRWKPELARPLIRERGLANIELVAGYVEDMKALYDEAHAVILPALNADSFKPCPHSGLHSLAHGKPVLASRAASIAGIVDREHCGVVFEPTVDSLCGAVTQLRANYDAYQVNTFRTLERKFSKSGFIERYGKLYASLL